MKKLITFLSMLYLINSMPLTASEYGQFLGTVKSEWLDDGRKMKLLEDFSYIDQFQIRWDAPKNWVVDGASIPKFAWSLIGGPFEGKYRKASVIHDVECDRKIRPWESVHEVFYNAMRAADVPVVKAKIMYAAVYHFGPRWAYSTTKTVTRSNVGQTISSFEKQNPESEVKVNVTAKSRSYYEISTNQPEKANIHFTVIPSQTKLTEEDFLKLKDQIETSNLELKEIRAYQP
ncbi:DUF1353 domain-containing protein [Vibrio natriegens]|uniref:DUF1353 domain-containing protein n=1 Tax=Vibrio natriegens TaxID=691 RepID=UPI003B5B5F93